MTQSNWTERDVEDWVCDNPRVVWDWASQVEVVGRQITLEGGGRLDVLLMARDFDGTTRMVVVEIKRDRVGLPAVDQLLTYLTDIEEVVPDGVRVCGVLVGTDLDSSVERMLDFIPSLYFVRYWAEFESEPVQVWHPVQYNRSAHFRYAQGGDRLLRPQFQQLNELCNKALGRLRAQRRATALVRLVDCPSPPERRLKAV